MKPQHVANISIRILALFLVYRGLEFGIAQMIHSQFATGMMEQSGTMGGHDTLDPKIQEMIRTLRIMTGIGALVPILLAVVLWYAAPILSRWMIPSEEDSRREDNTLPIRTTLIQVAAIIMIAMAASTLPQMAYDFQVAHQRDHTITLMTSKVFPDVIQFLAKIFIGGVMLLLVKKKLLFHPSPLAEQSGESDVTPSENRSRD